MKRLFTRLGLFGLLWISALAGYGQSVNLAISPNIICLNQNVQVYAVLSGVSTANVNSYTFYWNAAKTDSTFNDLSTGTPPKNNAFKLYTAAGAYKIGVVVRFSNRSDLTYEIWDTVYNPPTAAITLTSLDSQCYKGNTYCFLNNSTIGAFPSLPVGTMIATYGDGDSASMGAGGTICHSYTKGNSIFQVSVRATDVGGCWTKTFTNIFVAPNIDAAFAVSGFPKCDTTPYIFVNTTPVSPSSLLWFRWDYGDGDTFVSSSPPLPSEVLGPGNKWSGFTHYYTKSGVFDPILTVKHRYFNCTDQFIYSQSNNPLPENIIIRYDLRSRRSISNDTIADSVCNDNLNTAGVCLYNNYPLQGVNTQIQILWDFADPNANPPGSDKFLNNPTPCYRYQGMGHYFPSLYVGCPGKPVKRLNFWSRIDTAKASDSQYAPPPVTNPRLNTINGYLFSASDCISQYRDIYTVAGSWKSVASADPSTEEFTLPAHGFANGDSVKFTVTGSVSGITNCNTYYVQSVTSTTFKLALTPTGPPVDINLLSPPYVAPLMGKIDIMVFDSIVQYWKWFNNDYSKINYTKTRSQLQGFGLNIMGPLVQVEDPMAMPPVVIKPFLKSQCGPDLPVEFVNATNLYQSNNLYIRWDFANEYAPKCTSFSVPAPGMGFEPYTTANDMLNRTLGRFIVDGVIYPGRVNCKYSHDTLPIHSYERWDKVLNWFKYGHDFPPYDSSANGWTTDPAQVTWPIGPGPNFTGKKLVHSSDAATWGIPMYSSGSTPSRIDTLARMWPADILPNRPITLNNPIPDPIANLKGYWQYQIGPGHRLDTSSLFIFPNDLSKLPNGTLRRYRGNTPLGDGTTNTLYDYFFKRRITASYTVRLLMKDSFNNQSDDPYKSFTRINMVNGKIIIQQKTEVLSSPPDTVIHQSDTFSYTSTPPSIVNDTLIYNYKAYPLYSDNSTVPPTKYVLIRDDEFFVDYFDCGKEATITLPLVGVDAYGLGLNGKICPGLYDGINGGNPKIHFGATAGNPGLYPTGNQRTYLLFNFDSLLDRHDNTPCALDGFVQFDGTSPMFTPPSATTPGGTRWPPFNNAPNFNPLTVWQTINGAINNTHYMPTGAWPFSNSPIDPKGFVTVGLIIGHGCATFGCNAPACISDTVWYHNFMQYISLNGAFTYRKVGGNPVYGNPARLPSQDFTYDPVTKLPWSRLYGKGDIFEFETHVLQQDYVKADVWDWGDGIVTVDSFYTNPIDTFVKSPWDPNDSVFYTAFSFPLGRVRYEFNTETFPWTIISQTIPYPIGVQVLDTFHYDTIWQCWDLTHNAAPQSVTKVYTRIDTAFFIHPVRHQYNLSSWEMKAGPGSPVIKGDITMIQHNLITTTECSNQAFKWIVIGVMDTFMIKDNDAILCVGETGYFTDSIRYWYPKDDGVRNPSRPLDIGEYPLLSGYQTGSNPLTYWGSNTFDLGMANYPNDTIKKWANATRGGSIDDYFYERIYWDFESDGVIDFAGINPSHKFTAPGRFKVSMISRDTVGYFDTCFMFVDVVKPVANFTSKSVFQCSDPTIFFDSSYIMDDCFILTGSSCDQISVRHWWFGDIGYGPNAWRSEIEDPLYPYRKNGWYRVQESILTAQGCVDTVRKDIFIMGPRPRIKILNDTLGCTPYTIKVVTYPNDSGGVTTGATQIFSGRADGVGNTISTNNPDTITITYNKEGIYYVSAIGWDKFPANDCPPIHVPDTVGGAERPIRIIVKDPYHVDVDVSKPQVCVGEIFQVYNFSNRDTITKYRMYLYNQDFTTVLDTLYKTNFVQDTAWKYHLTSAGIYKVVLHSTRMLEGMPQCSSFDTVTVQARKAKAGLKIDSLGLPKFYVWNESDSANAAGYIWVIYNPDGSEKTKVIVPNNASQFYHLGNIDFKNDTGEFKICIWATTNNLLNCDDSVCKTVINNFQTEITIPNVFTPNADGFNDVFNIKIRGEELYELKIWNRWGGVVFESSDAQKMWNGRTQNTGAENPEGTYYYVFKYRLRGKTDQMVRGTITLIKD